MKDYLPDMQKSAPVHKTAIDKVGVRNMKIPFQLKRKNGTITHTIATVSSYCNLVADLKGINMSRISRTINDVLLESRYGFDNLVEFVNRLQQAHNTDEVWVKTEFEYLMLSHSPVVNIPSYEPVTVTFECRLNGGGIKKYVRVLTKEMSLCPCSKEMSLLINNLNDQERAELSLISESSSLGQKLRLSGFGAHSQKSSIDILVELKGDSIMWIEDIVAIAKQASSCSTFSTLKRPDEKYVTEAAYMGKYIDSDFNLTDTESNDGPKFVEDIARDCTGELNLVLDTLIADYVVVVNNEESIHSQDIYATAVLTAGRGLK
jgi:GTP cyclohydrolase IB